MDIATLEQTVARAERALERRIGEANALVAQAQSAKQSAADSEAFVLVCDEAISFLNSFSDSRQEEVRAQVEGLVTHGLRTIFSDSDMSFHVNHEQKGTRSEVSFSLSSMLAGERITTPILDARGGGVASVVGFLIRLVLTLLRSDAPLLVLDESFAQLSANFEPRLAFFLRDLVDLTGVQILMVTHSTAYSEQADVVYRVGISGGVTHVDTD